MKRFKRSGLIMPVILIVMLLQGCSTLWGPKPDIVSEEKGPGQPYSNAEKRRMIIDQPQMLSGDYFRERTDENQKIGAKKIKILGLGEIGIGSKNQEDENNPGASEKGTPGSIKIGLLVGEKVNHDSRTMLMRAIDRVLPDDLILVSPERLREVLASTECPAKSDIDCISRETALYPGVRMLVVAEALNLPGAVPGKAEIRFKVIDADFKYGYPNGHLTATVQDEKEVDSFLDLSCAAIFKDARRHAGVMPLHGRVFSVKSDRFYINAGKLNGVKPGDWFRVVPGGEMVRTPTGIPVGWVPEKETATIRVESLVGEDAAGCTLGEGKAPAVGDYVLPGQD